LNEDLSGDQLLDIATGGDSVELANTTMQCEGCSKNNVVYNTDSSPEQTEESADELENSIKNIDSCYIQ
jgi:expansin (peptidoglycan-binding protein)